MRRLLTLRWVIAHIVVLAVGLACAALGAWQLDRLEQRRQLNLVAETRYRADPVPITDLVAQAGSDLESLEYRRVTATGEFDASREVLVRSQVLQGRAGFDVVTPLSLSDGSVVAVNRGWVPLEFDSVPVVAAPPPAGSVTAAGIARPSQIRQGLGQSDPGGDVIPRIDLDTLADRFGGDPLGVYIEVIGAGSATQLPVPAPVPDFSDEGPHLNYAIQWFSFAVVGTVGYGFLLRRALRSGDG